MLTTANTCSLWRTTTDLPDHPPLRTEQRADVCIVGGGIAGLTTAYLLAREGKSVIVLDGNRLAAGETGNTTAHLSNAIDDRFTEIERLHGQEGARLAAESHGAAIDRIESIAREEGIDCDFERCDGYLFQPPGEAPEQLRKELEAAQRAGLADVEMLPRAPLPHYDTGPCLRFPRQGQFHPLKYLKGLAEVIRERGGAIYHATYAKEIEGGPWAKVTTRAGQVIHTRAVVVATNSPIIDLVAIHTKQAPYHTYVIGLAVPKGSIPHGLYWDTQDPYHYVRLWSGQSGNDTHDVGEDQEVLIVGGEDHKAGQADDANARFDRLANWTRERFPNAGEVLFRWSGQVQETLDGLAYIGRNPADQPNLYIATGDSGMGMTHGTIAGMLLTDLIMERLNPWAELYSPARKPVKAAWEYAKENLNVARQYTDWLTGGDVSSEAEIAPGSGAILRSGLSKIAAYRDEQGILHKCSAVCTHLGCIVAWNDAAKTWDCPCHGSRFRPEGQVLDGPALKDLEPVE